MISLHKRSIRTKSGFTLIELMIGLSVIAVLAAILIPKSGVFKTSAKNAGVDANIKIVKAAGEYAIATSKTADEIASKLKSSLDGNITNPINNTSTVQIIDANNFRANTVAQAAVFIIKNIPHQSFNVDDFITSENTSNFNTLIGTLGIQSMVPGSVVLITFSTPELKCQLYGLDSKGQPLTSKAGSVYYNIKK